MAFIALTLFWAPLSHAGACDHDVAAGVAGAVAIEPVIEAAPDDTTDEAPGDHQDAGHVCSCIGCHFHILAETRLQDAFASPTGVFRAGFTAQSAAASPGDLFRPPRA